MITRRKFLQASVVSLVAGLPSSGVWGSNTGRHVAAARGLHFFEASADFQTERVTAAAFHSDLWKLSTPTGGYDPFVLPSLRGAKFTFSQIKELGRPSEFVKYARRSDVFVALSQPDDPVSLNAALEHCDIAKRAGALTVLLAAEAFPDPEVDQTMQPKFFDRNLLSSRHRQPDAILSFTTLEPYMEMANVASLFGLQFELLHCTDFGDIKTVLDGKSDVVKLEGGAFGKNRGHRAAIETIRCIQDGKIGGRVIRGAVIYFVCGRNSRWLNESYAAIDVFNASLGQQDGTYVFGWVPARGDDADFFGITALVTV